MSIVDTLAEAQTRLYALANSDPDAARRIELMAIHSLVGMGVYDAMPKETTAENAMLAALELAESHIGWLWDHVEDRTRYQRTGSATIHEKIRAAIAAAKAAGIGEA